MISKTLSRFLRDDADLPSLSEKEAVLLQILGRWDENYHASEMVDMSKGQVGTSTVYVTLNRMVEKGYVASSKKEGSWYVASSKGSSRRTYTITKEGMRVLALYEKMAKKVSR